MQHMKLKLRKLGEVKVGLILLCIGIVLGILFARIFKGFYWNQIDMLDTSYFSKIRSAKIDYSVLFKYVLWKNFRTFLLFWIFCATAFGLPYITFSIVFTGIQSGFFLAVILMRYNLKGILLIFGYTFPQFIIYIPVALLCLRSGYWLCCSMYHDIKMSKRGKVEKIAKHMVLIMILAVVLLVGGFLETYAGSFILKKILLLF